MEKEFNGVLISIEKDGVPEHNKDVFCRVKTKDEGIKYHMGHRMNTTSETFIVGNYFEWDIGKVTHWMEIDELFF
jgi:hypothetical protein